MTEKAKMRPRTLFPRVSRWIERRPTLWQFVVAVATVAVMVGSIYNSYQSRRLFELQNRPYIDLKEITGVLELDPSKNRYFGSFKLVPYSSGNMPGIIERVRCTLRFQDLSCDSVFFVNTIIFPNEHEVIEMKFGSEQLDSFYTSIVSAYPQQKADYRAITAVYLTVFYECNELRLSDSIKSRWKFTGSNYLVRY